MSDGQADGVPIWRPESRPKSREETNPYATLPALRAMRRGALNQCPACGEAPLFETWLRQAPVCARCEAPLGRIRADDAPPYFTIFVVAHVIVGLLVLFESLAMLSIAAELAIFLPLTLILTLALIRPVKGATIGLMLKLGFAAPDEAAAGRHA